MKLDTEFLNGVLVLAFLVWPGLLSVQVYRLRVAGDSLDWGKVSLQGFFYSVLNYVLLFWAVLYLADINNEAWYPVRYWALFGFVYLVAPILWPLAWLRFIESKWATKHLQHPHPTAWDYFFDKREEVFVIAKLKDGKRIGGLFKGGESFAAAYPQHGDLYLSMVYELDEESKFKGPVPFTRGLLLRRDEYSYLELFAIPPQEEGPAND